jgi:hypothetical protein
MEPGHFGVYPGFVQEDQAAGIPTGLLTAPKHPGRLNVGPVLLGGARRFFLAQSQPPQAMPQGGDPDGNVESRPAPVLEFSQGQVRLGFNPALHEAVVFR